MGTERADLAYGIWRDAADKFDYFVLGASGALAAYIGQNLKPVRLGANPATLELIALAAIVASVVLGFKRVEATITLFQLQHKALHSEESAGELMDASQRGPMLNKATGQVLGPVDARFMADLHGERARDLRQQTGALRDRTGIYYAWRNRCLFGGVAILAVARILPAYIG